MEEAECVRVALRVLSARYGSKVALARRIGVHVNNVARWVASRGHTARAPTAAVALEVARIAGVSVDDVLSGEFPAPNSCPICGRRDD